MRMKNSLLVLAGVLAFLIIPFISNGQEKGKPVKSKPGSHVGFYGGLSLSTLQPDGKKFVDAGNEELLQGNSSYNFSLKPVTMIGFSAGVYYYGKVSGRVYFQTEVALSMRGLEMKGENFRSGLNNMVIKEYLILNYVSIPCYAKIYLFEKDNQKHQPQRINAYVLAGPSVDISTGRMIKTAITVKGETGTNAQPLTGYTPITYSLNFGAGLELAKFLDLQFRYSLGLTNVANKNAIGDLQLKNSTFMINLGFNWPV